MPTTISAFKTTAFLSFGLLTASCATAQQSSTDAQESSSSKSQLNLKKGQYLSITMPEAKTSEPAKKARGNYYKTAFPLGAEYGLKREASLTVDDVIISTFKPSNVIFFSYPDKQSEQKLANHPQWSAIKASRPSIWNTLNIFSAELTKDIDITFDPAKSYTLVVAWKKEGSSDEYDKYLNGIEPAMARSGGRFIYKMRNPQFESNDPDAAAPSQLTFVEWDSVDGFSKVRASDEYKVSVGYFQAGVKKIEFYRMSSAK